MTRSNRNTLIIISAIIVAVVVGGIYFIIRFFSALAPAEITITNTEISSSRGFINPITIEKLKVDSIGEEQRPVKYVIEYLTTCAIKQEAGKPPESLNKIKLNGPGRYTWSQQVVNIPITHEGTSRSRMDSMEGIIWSLGSQNLDLCPIKFETENWYFITFLDPQIVGAYIFINKKGELRQFMTYTGVSPI